MAKPTRRSDGPAETDRANATIQDHSLTDEGQKRDLARESKSAWLDRFTRAMGEPGPEEEAFFADRRRRGLGVGLDENGDLVRAAPEPDPGTRT